MINRIRIQNYRSLIDVDVQLEPLTVLIGKSGTGKSNFVRAIRFLRDFLTNRQGVHLTDMLPLGSSPSPVSISVHFYPGKLGDELEYFVSIKPNRALVEEFLVAGKQTVFHQLNGKWIVEPQVSPKVSTGSPCLGSLTGIREATIAHISLTRGLGCYDFPGNVLQGEQPGSGSKGYRDDGMNPRATAGDILDDLDQLNDWTAITKSLRSLNKQFRSLDLRLPSRDHLEVGYEIGGTLHMLNVAQESEGFRRYLAHLLALYQNPAKQTLVFEHPESGIHPGALESLFHEFDRHVKRERGQVILTTHSPQLLDYFAPESIRVVDIEGHSTKIGPLAPEQLESLRDNLLHPGELLTVDPARLEGQLIGEP